MIRFLFSSVVLALVIASFVSGCRSMTPSVTYYTLNPITNPSELPQAGDNNESAPIVGIRPVDLPGYINRVQMVTRNGSNQLEISSIHRWADYPDRLVQQIVGENLQLLLPDVRVMNSPWPMGLKPDVTITFQFLELIGTTDKKVLLSAIWTVVDRKSENGTASHRINLQEPQKANGYDELAAAQSRILATFCRKVSESLNDVR
jgi:uncharacterized protein